jgi:RNA recognition motif-containing protein
MRLFVGNLPFRATERELEEWFGQAGVTVVSVSVIHDRSSGESRGFGFVEVADHAQGEAAIRALNGKAMLGRTLVVNEARPAGVKGGRGGSDSAGR